ncbi:50S ribosomal protein L25/general stress protein Ctc [Desertivibrio insolitus]|uniref:50S ribosomal protein L25/general stress protein Ctc n=1 Tax=Herbiconiux sp. SYSU D00978 TaxID=2812562 RepID=UPI001A9671FF|nr:50S ribosomal protein L25/general stress protein Ctc [Herbiconiux sp. SYSU D00978]
MADDNKLSAEVRTNFGKGAARKIRAVNKIPAVLYGHGTDPRHLTLPGHELMLLVRKSNQVLELDIAGETELALVKDVQRDPVKQIIEHVDLVIVKRGEKVTVDIPVIVEGEPAAGTTINQDANTISVEAEATHIPENVTVSVEGLEAGAQITAAEVTLPAGSTLLTEPTTLVVGVVGEQVADEPVGEAEGAAEGDGDVVPETTDSAE